MVRRSVPASSRCVAQLWRTRWGVTLLRMPALLAASLQVRHTILSVIGCSESRCMREGNRYVCGLSHRQWARSVSSNVWAQRQVTILASLAVYDMNDHALAVDVGYLQPCYLRPAHSLCRTEPSAAYARKGRCWHRSDVPLPPGSESWVVSCHTSGIGQELAELMPMKRSYEQKPQRSQVVLDCSRVQLPHLEQISLIGAKMIGTELVWGLAKVLCEPLDKTQITSRQCSRNSCDARVPRASSCEGWSQ